MHRSNETDSACWPLPLCLLDSSDEHVEFVLDLAAGLAPGRYFDKFFMTQNPVGVSIGSLTSPGPNVNRA